MYGCILLWALLLPVLLIVTVWLWLPADVVWTVFLAPSLSQSPLVPLAWAPLIYPCVCSPVILVEAVWLCDGNSPTGKKEKSIL